MDFGLAGAGGLVTCYISVVWEPSAYTHTHTLNFRSFIIHPQLTNNYTIIVACKILLKAVLSLELVSNSVKDILVKIVIYFL